MSLVAIGEAVTGGALRATHFFNGRLLTGEDLAREQDVQATRLARLGSAIGAGVAEGLRVTIAGGSTASRPRVTVSPGLAVSRSGLALELPQETDVSLAASGPSPGSEPGALFAECEPFQPSEYSTGAGVYLLSVGPHVTEEGLAPVSGLHNEDAPCNTAYAVEAVAFRRIRLALPLAELDDRERLRNRAAYRIFAAEDVEALWRDPLATQLLEYGHLDALPESCLGPDEVPLALIGWEAGEGIEWIDHWSVRRRLNRRVEPDRHAPLAGDRLLSEGEARFLQFQEHLEALRRGRPAAPAIVATSRFRRLPPAGLIPLAGTGTDARGFDLLRFFEGLPTHSAVHIEGASVQPLLRESFAHPAIDLAAEEAICLYVVRENQEQAARRYALFATAHLVYRADARCDAAYWNRSNYAESC